jgi:pyridoxal phosphate enzyme (YggS family)
MSTISENISEIKTKIKNAKLVAVSKTHGIEKVREALACGQRIFGENRVQEAESKFPELRKEYNDIELHLIGPLQTNKVKEALELFDVIQTLDREKLALAIAKEHGTWSMEHKNPASMLQPLSSNFFIQINIGEEPQKAGIAPQQTAEFFKFCTQDLKLPVTGLMCIPPVDEPAFMYFALLRNIAKGLNSWTVEQLNGNTAQPLNRSTANLKLSMGMSGDYMEAVEMGADYVRIGSAIFGERRLISVD